MTEIFCGQRWPMWTVLRSRKITGTRSKMVSLWKQMHNRAH
nr:MAG TPA: hypothetical protein [Caudoviricetes sp.]